MEVSTWNVLLTCFVWAPLHGGERSWCVVPLVREPTVLVIDPTKVTVTRVTTQHTRIRNLQVGYWLHPTTLAVFRISFRPIRELPIKSNPNCSVNWLTAQKVKKVKYHQFSVIQLVSFQSPFVKRFPGPDGQGKNTPRWRHFWGFLPIMNSP